MIIFPGTFIANLHSVTLITFAPNLIECYSYFFFFLTERMNSFRNELCYINYRRYPSGKKKAHYFRFNAHNVLVFSSCLASIFQAAAAAAAI